MYEKISHTWERRWKGFAHFREHFAYFIGKVFSISRNSFWAYWDILCISRNLFCILHIILCVSKNILCTSAKVLGILRYSLSISQKCLCILHNILCISANILCILDLTNCLFQETLLKKYFLHFRKHFVNFFEKDFVYFSKHFVHFGKCILHLSATVIQMYNRCSRIKYLNKVYYYILNFYFWIWSKKVCLETILHLFKIYQYLQRVLRITKHILNPW